MTPEQIDELPDYTDAQLLKVYRYALARGWAGTKRKIEDQDFEFPGPEQMMKLIETLEARIRRDDPNDADNDGTALAVFLPPQ